MDETPAEQQTDTSNDEARRRLQLRSTVVESTKVIDNERYVCTTKSTLEEIKVENFNLSGMYTRINDGGTVKDEPINISDSEEEEESRNQQFYHGVPSKQDEYER